ncbi:ferritin-like domain-containing protein [Gordonia soli]|uniref:DUF4439 domain-containing protein n=1 Tax=Gordonia soli NBRC 108243 TaxID=1223545 RepID=M0QKZ4_9ACTN|nr:ferritin-like domain-containing protein [Gordonia soli]GAC68941.1 hypothetical protein GS4_20_00060 [Gordonia soli NBRC 108243]
MSPTTDAVGTAVDAENAAIFTYGVTTAFTTGATRARVAEYIASHRARRDELNQTLVSAGAAQRDPAPGYTLPVSVDDAPTARRAALAAETDCAEAYRAMLETADTPQVRRLALDGLRETAGRAAQWRRTLGVRPTTVAFPGSPQ